MELNYGRTFGLILQKPVHLLHRTIEGNNGEAMIGGIHDQILAHNGQTNKAKITTWNSARMSADIDAGETGATVSPLIPSTEYELGNE